MGLKWRSRGSKNTRRTIGLAPSTGPPDEVERERHDQNEQNGWQRHHDYVSHAVNSSSPQARLQLLTLGS